MCVVPEIPEGLALHRLQQLVIREMTDDPDRFDRVGRLDIVFFGCGSSGRRRRIDAECGPAEARGGEDGAHQQSVHRTEGPSQIQEATENIHSWFHSRHAAQVAGHRRVGAQRVDRQHRVDRGRAKDRTVEPAAELVIGPRNDTRVTGRVSLGAAP
jgi:hypothetical protein